LLQREHRWLLEQLTAVEAAGEDDPAVADRVRIVLPPIDLPGCRSICPGEGAAGR
jgi:hypothetical protein